MRSIVKDYRVMSQPGYKQNNTTTKVKCKELKLLKSPVYEKSNTTGVTFGAEKAHRFGASEITPSF